MTSDNDERVAEHGIPNLDDVLDEADLQLMQEVFVKLADYAWHKRHAMVHRKRGAIELANAREMECNKIYAALPAWARW